MATAQSRPGLGVRKCGVTTDYTVRRGLEGAQSLDIFAKAMRTNTEYFLHYEGDQAGSQRVGGVKK